MRIAVTGAGGFIGRRLVAELQARGSLDSKPIEQLILVDQAFPTELKGGRIPERRIVGDIGDRAVRDDMFRDKPDAIFHFAAMLTAGAEREFDNGVQLNLYGFMNLLEACRRQGGIRLIFSSSMAVFGGALPDIVTDDLAQRPQNSYGVQKGIAELLIDDYTRRSFIDGRALRLPVVLLRGTNDTPTLSEHISAVVREPLLGRRAVCPFDPKTPMPVISVGAVARAFCTLFELPTEVVGPVRTMNLPALTVTFEDMVAAVERRVGPQARGLIDWRLDLQVAGLLTQMPKRITSSRAIAVGIDAEASFDAVIEDFLANAGR
jgi:nucleoside-diphosphate-sugar epimerase